MIRRVAQTEHSEVYLVRHIQLSVYRIAKVVQKSNTDCERILREADIIKNIKHTGIPLVYDIEEDSDSICVIEEYIAGNSLSEYIAKGRLSVRQMVTISVKICEVLEYLHNYEDIIHMDLKPGNIIIRENNSLNGNLDLNQCDVSIIDFDSSVSVGRTDFVYGSVGFAAPEQYETAGTCDSAKRGKDAFLCGISKRTDCYSVGMLLLYMACEGHVQSMAENADKVCTLYSDTIGPVIRRCIRHNQSQRFDSIEELKKELIKVLTQENNKNINTKKAYDIYVYGIKRGVGTTHVSLCIAAFLKRFFAGKKVLYRRIGDREDVFLEAGRGRLTGTGAYKSHGIYIMPDYGECIRCNLSGFDVIVHDCGAVSKTDEAHEVKADHIIYVGDCGYRKSDIAFMNNISNIGTETSVFINHISGREFYNFVRANRGGGKARIIEKDERRSVRYYRMPCMYEWYESNKLFEEAVIEALKLEKKCR